jgi:magnesium transporter
MTSEHQSLRPRRQSVMGSSAFGVPIYDPPSSHRPQYQNPFHKSSENVNRRPKTASKDSDREEDVGDERTPLIPSSARAKSSNATFTFGGEGGSRPILQNSARRRPSSKSSSKSRHNIYDRPNPSFPHQNESYNVNYPPSVPGSPTLSASNRNMSFGDLMTRNEFSDTRDNVSESAVAGDQMSRVSSSPRRESGLERRHTIALQAEEDVCFPIEGMSEAADDDTPHRGGDTYRRGTGVRRRRSRWPDLAMLDDWSRFEKEGRSDERRAKKITEPQLIGGRLRPIHKGWHRAEDDAPYRFTYFNEEFPSTIHSQTISELVQPGGTFRELFIPDPPELEDSSDSEDEDEGPQPRTDSQIRHVQGLDGDSRAPTRQGSLFEQKSDHRHSDSVIVTESKDISGEATPNGGIKSPEPPKGEKPKRYGERPTWWLDVLSPTDAEMKVISKTFGIHPLTAEDIMMQEAREKVELFRNYYFVNYRSFEQDMNNEDFLEPVNMYVVVFREGVISFHFSMTPHPANVRRRIRQLKDFLILSSDWISYAIIDDITDVFAPLIQNIEDEVDDIDDAILKLHSPSPEGKPSKDNEKGSDYGDGTSGESGGDMLRRVGDCRKKVMGLYRLLGNKADVIKGFAKRCNEHWEIAPRSEIGLYLGDIQDHIVTMTSNLSHYEK